MMLYCVNCKHRDKEYQQYPCSICKHNKVRGTVEYDNAHDFYNPKSDNVNHPSHYNTASVECIDVMLELFGDNQVASFCLCNAFTYLWRCEHKTDKIEDIRKAIWNLNKAVEILEK